MLEAITFNQERLGLADTNRGGFPKGKQNAIGEFERFRGAQNRGYALGLHKKHTTDTVAAPNGNTNGGISSTTSASSGAATTHNSTINTKKSPHDASSSTLINGETALLLMDDEVLNIRVSIVSGSAEKASKNKGVVDFEEGGSYVFRTSDHPGSKYAIHGLEGGNGVNNPNNIKGHIYLNSTSTEQKPLLKPSVEYIDLSTSEDPVVGFLKKMTHFRDSQKDQDKKEAQGLGREDKEKLKSNSRQKDKILNIHDDRFDKSSFTNREAISLSVAQNLAENKPRNSDLDSQDQSTTQKGRKLGHYKNGLNLADKTHPSLISKGYSPALVKDTPHPAKGIIA